MKLKGMDLWKGLLVLIVMLTNFSAVKAEEEMEEVSDIEIDLVEENLELSENDVQEEMDVWSTYWEIDPYLDEESGIGFAYTSSIDYPVLESVVVDADEVFVRVLLRADKMSEIKGYPTFTDGDFFYQYGSYDGVTGFFMMESDGSYRKVDDINVVATYSANNGCFVKGTYWGDANAIVGYSELCGGEVVIPDGTKTIGKFAFATADNVIDMNLSPIIESVDLPEDLKIIGTGAFNGQSKLKEVSARGRSHQIPESVEWMGDYVFYGTALGYLNFKTPANYSACYVNGTCDPILESSLKGYVKKQSNGSYVYDFNDERNLKGISLNRILWNEGTDLGGGTYDNGKLTFNDVPESFKYRYKVADGYWDTDINTVNIEVYSLSYRLREGDKGSLSSYQSPIVMDGVTSVGDQIAGVDLPKGYEFSGYFINDEQIDVDTLKSKVITEDTVVELRTVPSVYPIVYELNGGVNDSSNPGSYTVEDSVSFKDPVRNGYEFKGWYVDSQFNERIEGISAGSSGEVKVYAEWSPVVYKVSYELNGGINSKDNPVSYTVESDDILIKDASKEGYLFKGWKEGNTIAHGSTGDKVFTAVWEVEPYVITYVLNGGINDESNPDGYTIESEDIVIKDASREGYEFIGWKEGNTIVHGSTGDKVFTAQFKPVSYVINYDMDGGENHPDNPGSYDIETPTITLKDPVKKGYSFLTWVEGNQIPQGSTGIKHFTASWKIESYPVTFIGFEKKEVNKQSVNYNEKAEKVDAPSVSEYYFDGWYYDEAFTKKYSFDDPILGETIVYGSYKPIYKVKETSTEVQKFTEDECGTVKDEWGNVVYAGTKCQVSESYSLPNTGEGMSPVVKTGFATMFLSCLTPLMALVRKKK